LKNIVGRNEEVQNVV